MKCTPATLTGRRRKAEQFAEAADLIAELDATTDVADSYVTLLVHAGIAASDVLCCAHLGEHATGESHNDAVALLAKVDRKLAEDLRTLLAMKTKAGYSHQLTTRIDQTRAQRAADRLLAAMR